MAKIPTVKIARLANLPISRQEEKIYENQLSKILEYIDQIEKEDLKDIEPTFNVSDSLNQKRPDEIVGNSLSQEEALQNAKNQNEGHIETKGIFEDE